MFTICNFTAYNYKQKNGNYSSNNCYFNLYDIRIEKEKNNFINFSIDFAIRAYQIHNIIGKMFLF